MRQVFITGSSRGIGRALTELLLQDGNTIVTGISRSDGPAHERYTHVSLDLSDLDAVQNFSFEVAAEATELLLINNAGLLGDVSPVGRVDDKSIIATYNVNLISPSILMNRFAGLDVGVNVKRTVVNVSSGAGKYAIDGWATYCATKAGLDLFSQTMAEEQNLREKAKIRVLSIAPGVVDTGMQEEIRTSTADEFSRIADFIEYKNSGNLADAAQVARKYLYILNHSHQYPDVLYSVRDVELQENL